MIITSRSQEKKKVFVQNNFYEKSKF